MAAESKEPSGVEVACQRCKDTYTVLRHEEQGPVKNPMCRSCRQELETKTCKRCGDKRPSKSIGELCDDCAEETPNYFDQEGTKQRNKYPEHFHSGGKRTP